MLMMRASSAAGLLCSGAVMICQMVPLSATITEETIDDCPKAYAACANAIISGIPSFDYICGAGNGEYGAYDTDGIFECFSEGADAFTDSCATRCASEAARLETKATANGQSADVGWFCGTEANFTACRGDSASTARAIGLPFKALAAVAALAWSI